MTAPFSRYEAFQSGSEFAMKTILFAVAGLVISLTVALAAVDPCSDQMMGDGDGLGDIQGFVLALQGR